MADNSKPSVVVVSNTAAGGTGGHGKDPVFKIPKIKADFPTLLTVGGVVLIGGGVLLAFPYIANFIQSIIPVPGGAQLTSGATTSGAGTTTPPQTTIQGGVYPGTGAGNFPPPSSINPYTGQPITAQYPYTNQQGIPIASPTGIPTVPGPLITPTTPTATPGLGGVVRTYHAVMGDNHYLDKHGKRRNYMHERHIEELIGSEDIPDRRLQLIEESK